MSEYHGGTSLKEAFIDLLSAGLGIIAANIWIIYTTRNTLFIFGSPLGNIKIYIISVLIFGLVSFAVCPLLHTLKLEKLSKMDYIFKNSSRGLIAVGIAIIMFFGGVLTWVMKLPMLAVVFYLFAAVYLWISTQADSSLGKYFLWGIILFLGIINMRVIGVINYFPDTFYPNTHHASAVLDQIYNISMKRPYFSTITDQYGHYGILLKPFFEIFGYSMKNFGIIMGILAMLTYLCLAIAIYLTVPSNGLRMIFIFLIGFLQCLGHLSVYWQSMPLRFIFPALAILFVAIISKHQLSIGAYIAGTVLSGLAIVWNTETGIAVILAIAAVFLLKGFVRGKSVKGFLRSVGLAFLSLAGAFLISWLLYAAYNVIHGGGIPTLAEMYFFKSFGAYVMGLQTQLEWRGDLSYIYKLSILMLSVAWGGFRLLFEPVDEEETVYLSYSLVATSVIGLVMMTYFMNRTLAGDGLVDAYVLFDMVILYYQLSRIISKQYRERGFSLSCIGLCVIEGYLIMVLFLFCAIFNHGSPLRFYEGIRIKHETGAYDYSDFKRLTEEIAEVVPENTWAAGGMSGTGTIYMELGWDNFHDLGDIRNCNEEAMFIPISRFDWENLVLPDDRYELVATFTYEYKTACDSHGVFNGLNFTMNDEPGKHEWGYFVLKQ